MAAVGCQSNHIHVSLLAFTNIWCFQQFSGTWFELHFAAMLLEICTTATEILGQILNMHLLWMAVWNKYGTILTTSMNQCCSSCWFSLDESSAANSTACWWFIQAEALSFVHHEKIGMKWLCPGWMMQHRSCRVFRTGVSDSTKAGADLCPAPGGRGWGALMSLNPHISCLRMCGWGAQLHKE